MARMKILISGAGIAGNALAFWLSKLGHDITVVERFASLRTTGLQIDLRGHGIEVMKRMGLEQSFRSKMVPEQGTQVVDSWGIRRAYFPANKTSGKDGQKVQSFTTDYEIMRGDLCILMYDATKHRAKYIFGNSVESFEEKDDGVSVRFSDGTTDQFDLWVGADGSASRTRKMMLGPGATDAFYPLTNLYVAYFTIPQPIVEGEEYIATTYQTTGRRGILTRRSNPHEIQVYLGCKSDSERIKNARPGDVIEEKAAFAEIFKGAGWQTERFLESMKYTDNFYCERMGLVKLDPWFRKHVALVGDAAYCPTANTGMGTTSGMVGAYILAGEIGKHCGSKSSKGKSDGLTTALEAYDAKFRPFMDRVQKGVDAEDSTWDKVSSTWVGIGFQNLLMGMASMLKIDIYGFMQVNLKEDVGDWELPEYRELL